MLQEWVLLFAIIGGIIAALTAGWRVINFLRTETKEAIKDEHNFNVEQHNETRKVVKDALQGIDDKFRDVKEEIREVKSQVSRVNDIRVEIAVNRERIAKHEDAIKYLNKITGNNNNETNG